MASKFCVSLTHSKDNTDKATVGFVVANAAVGSGKETMVFLSVEGVRLAQRGFADGIHEEGFAPLRELMDNFGKAGGTIYVCSPCFKKRKLDENNLVAGASIVGGAKLVEFLSDGSFDGGDLDCGNGLLLLIRQHIDPLAPGQLLEFTSTEVSVEADFPAWCRMTGNELLSVTRRDRQRSFLVCKGPLAARGERPAARPAAVAPRAVTPVHVPATLPPPARVAPIPPLAVMGIGSWPRPRWMLAAIHEHLEGRLADAEFESTAEDATRLAVGAQLRAGADVVTDGEQRRDNYASFVGGRLDNCKLIPLTDLLPLVDHPEEFEREMQSLDVPAAEVRHPAVFGPLGRREPLAREELEIVRAITDRPVKIALPGPYLLTRMM